jgi:hypothetical protein
MVRVWLTALALALASAACQQLPPSPEDLEAKKFQAVPDKAVIYVVRDSPDHSNVQAQIRVGDKLLLKTYPGTYFRWEVPAGTHVITGFGEDIGTISVQAERGRIYFVQQRVTTLRVPNSYFSLVGEPEGRAAVMRSALVLPFTPLSQ